MNQSNPQMIVEVRRCVVDVVKFQSKKTGRAESFTKLTVGAEVVDSGNPAIVSIPLPDGATADNVKIPFVKGQKVRFHLSKLDTVSGVIQARSDEYEVVK